MNTLATDIGNWLRKPFDANGSALDWLMFVGLLVIAAFMWSTVLMLIRE